MDISKNISFLCGVIFNPLEVMNKFSLKLVLTLTTIFCAISLSAQDNTKKDRTSTGVSVSPAHFHFNQKPGEVKSYDITVNNNTKTTKQFKVNIYDFDMNKHGKSSFLPAGKGKYSLSKWTMLSPTFIELKPFEKKKVKVTVSVPESDAGRKAAWSILMIEQEAPRTSLLSPKKSGSTVALGVIPTFAFGVFAYQNPPNVDANKVEFRDFTYTEKQDKSNQLRLEVENTGDGIAYCTSYIDLTNLDTGDQQRLKVKKFTIIPELIRNFNFTLPPLPKGKYLAVGVLDYESSDEIQAAKLEFEIK